MSDIKIRSKYLNVLNEAIQKMVINDTIKAFTPVIVEADGKFSSVLNTNDDFDLSSLGSNIESTEVSAEENSEQEVNETKTQLLNKAKNAMNKSLEASNEFQQILAKIKKLSQTTDFDTWVVNKEGNTASLKSKKANIFKQNNNLLATGVQMEALSIEDNGKGIKFNIFIYNIQPGIKINYETGESSLINE